MTSQPEIKLGQRWRYKAYVWMVANIIGNTVYLSRHIAASDTWYSTSVPRDELLADFTPEP